MWFVGNLGKVASVGSMARSARHFDLALATTKAVARKSAARIFTGVRVGRWGGGGPTRHVTSFEKNLRNTARQILYLPRHLVINESHTHTQAAALPASSPSPTARKRHYL